MLISNQKFSRTEAFKTAIIDIGSNSVRIVILKGIKRSPEYFYNEKVICKLGFGVKAKGFLNPEGITLAFKTLARFSLLISKMKVDKTIGVATAAVREAKDGQEFLGKVSKETGIPFRVLSGRQEAKYSAKGVLFGWPKANGLVCDIGGLSVEFCEVLKGEILSAQSVNLGPLAFANEKEMEGQKRSFKHSLKKINSKLTRKNKSVFLVGGAWRALAKVDMELKGYPLKILHEYRMRSKEMEETASWCLSQSEAEIIKRTGLSKARVSSIKHACRVILDLILILKPDKFFVSSYGLREGLFFEKLDECVKVQDPLIEVSLDYEKRSARFPGFGAELYDWILPIFSKLTKLEQKVILSACLLHDTIWFAHPDYRSELCVETITRANMVGIDHSGRLFLGLALAFRYKGGAQISELPTFRILRQRDKEKAIILGKAMRLGALLSGSALGGLRKAKLSVSSKELILMIDEDVKALAGGIVKKRLVSLGDALNLKAKLVIENV